MVEGLPTNFSFIILLINILPLSAGFYLNGVILWFVINIYFDPFPHFLAHRYCKPWNYLSNKSNGNVICYNIWSSSVLKIASELLGWNECLVIHKCLSTTPEFVSELTFGNLLKMIWGWFPGKPTKNRKLKLSVPPCDFWVGGRINHQWPMI